MYSLGRVRFAVNCKSCLRRSLAWRFSAAAAARCAFRASMGRSLLPRPTALSGLLSRLAGPTGLATRRIATHAMSKDRPQRAPPSLVGHRRRRKQAGSPRRRTFRERRRRPSLGHGGATARLSMWPFPTCRTRSSPRRAAGSGFASIENGPLLAGGERCRGHRGRRPRTAIQ